MFTLGLLLLSFNANCIFMCTLCTCSPIFGCWHRVKVNGDTDVSETHFGFVFRTDVNRATLQRAIEHFSALFAIQPTSTRFPRPEMDSASTVTKRPSLLRDVTQLWLGVNWLSPFQGGLLGPIFKGQAVQVP